MTDDTPRLPHLTRRGVVRTAAHTAWAAPVIVAVTAAPAAATSLPGMAVIVTGAPSFTPVFGRIRTATRIANEGTATPASMSVTVTLTPVAGDIIDAPPTFVRAGFMLSTITYDEPIAGAQTLVFLKVAPQIAPTTDAELVFDFNSTADALAMRRGTVTVIPTVPAPGTATSNFADYASTGNPPATRE